MDEPERHLHPRVVSQLAGWLRDLVRVRDSQGLVVTHAVPFINQADALAYVRRDGIGASVRSCSHDELGALSEIAAELGLDRGQLLADTEVILFVEGRSDQYVLEGLFGDRLRQIGVAVVPLHGATQLAQVVDSQLLLRFSTARLAALIDDLDESEIQRLQNDREYLEAATRSRKTEEQALAKLLKEAFAQGRSLTALGLPAKDIFFLLDADAIRETFRELRRTDSVVRTDAQAPDFADYPGHDQFWAEFGKSAQENEKWKAFCERRYGIPYADVSWYARVADHMHARKKFPSALVDVVDRLARLAL